jgi:hypothetical protein
MFGLILHKIQPLTSMHNFSFAKTVLTSHCEGWPIYRVVASETSAFFTQVPQVRWLIYTITKLNIESTNHRCCPSYRNERVNDSVSTGTRRWATAVYLFLIRVFSVCMLIRYSQRNGALTRNHFRLYWMDNQPTNSNVLLHSVWTARRTDIYPRWRGCWRGQSYLKRCMYRYYHDYDFDDGMKYTFAGLTRK